MIATIIPVMMLIAAAVFFVYFVFGRARSLPDRVAVHFSFFGKPNGWLSSRQYRVVIVLFGLGVTVLVVTVCYMVKVLVPSSLNVPHADHWRSTGHYDQACAFLFHSSLWLGTALLLWMSLLHHVIVVANRTSPPALAPKSVVYLVVSVGVVIILWIVAMNKHFAHM
jgi:hypothetical protein